MAQFKDLATNEILSILPKEVEEEKAFLSALIKVCGSITLSHKRMNVEILLNNGTEAAFVINMLKDIYPTEFEIVIEKAHSGIKKGNEVYKVLIPQVVCKEALVDLRLMENVDGDLGLFVEGVPNEYLSSRALLQNYFRGLYLAGGSCYVPSLNIEDVKKDGYHFEYCFEDENTAENINEVIKAMGVNSKVSERGTHFLCYIKDKDDILKILLFMELNECALQLQKIIDERETANSINRASICEAHNLDKTFTAASKQLLAIGMIEEKVGLSSLSEVLQDAARVRMEYPQSSLQELADILDVSKSCLNHRLRKIMEISEELENEDKGL